MDYAKDEPLVIAAAHFWSDGLNAFLFANGPMTPTLLDVKMIIGLKIDTLVNLAAIKNQVTHHRIETSGKLISGWSGYMTTHMKTGRVDHREHVAFLMMWLEHFIFCGPTLAPTANFQLLAEQLADNKGVAFGRILLGETYKTLHDMAQKLIKGETLSTGGPWWFVQMFLHL